MITAVVFIFLLVFMIWPETQLKFESAVRRRLPRLYYISFHAVRRYHSDIQKRFPTSRQRGRLR
jgi:hypothetical protein